MALLAERGIAMTLEDLCIKHNVTIYSVQIPHRTRPWDDKPEPIERSHWHVTLNVGGKLLWVGEYSHGDGGMRVGRWFPAKPKAADVLACLLSDASNADQPFEDWAADLGYNSDSREAYRTWETCVEIRRKLTRSLPDFEAFAEAAADY